MIVFAVDRDATVSTSAGPVPIEWIRRLRETDEVVVRAIGNQRLCEEAGIEGIDGLEATTHAAPSIRAERLRQVEATYPDADAYIHVDDVDVGADEWPQWTHYSPDAFVRAVRNGEVPGADRLTGDEGGDG